MGHFEFSSNLLSKSSLPKSSSSKRLTHCILRVSPRPFNQIHAIFSALSVSLLGNHWETVVCVFQINCLFGAGCGEVIFHAPPASAPHLQNAIPSPLIYYTLL